MRTILVVLFCLNLAACDKGEPELVPVQKVETKPYQSLIQHKNAKEEKSEK